MTWEARVHQLRGCLSVPVTATFRYTTADPFAVRIAFRPPHAPPVVWYLARELLISGTRVLSGVGDARVRPAPGPGREGLVHLRLGTVHSHALFAVDRSALSRWLARSCTLVPPGTEAEFIDWDTFTGSPGGA